MCPCPTLFVPTLSSPVLSKPGGGVGGGGGVGWEGPDEGAGEGSQAGCCQGSCEVVAADATSKRVGEGQVGCGSWDGGKRVAEQLGGSVNEPRPGMCCRASAQLLHACCRHAATHQCCGCLGCVPPNCCLQCFRPARQGVRPSKAPGPGALQSDPQERRCGAGASPPSALFTRPPSCTPGRPPPPPPRLPHPNVARCIGGAGLGSLGQALYSYVGLQKGQGVMGGAQRQAGRSTCM